MNTFTKTLSISAVAVALAGGIGFAYAQSNGASGDPLINPDPNAALTTPSTPSTNSADQGRTAGAGVDSNTTYGHSRDGNMNNNNSSSQSGLAGEGVRSNNSYGNTRDTNGANTMPNGSSTDSSTSAPVERAPRADRN